MSQETKIGRYLVESLLGEGAMGSVYRAVDPMIKRVVAIKKIRLDQVSSPQESEEFKQRLFQEAQISGILLHPNIVVVYDVGEEDGMPFIAMEYVEGETLKELMKRQGSLDRSRVADIVGKISSGLQYAHEHHIIHRDIKPQNIMVSKQGEAKIMDFGIAKFIDTHMTKTGIFLGTPAYSSPEQIKGEDVDFRSDIFSLGVLAHELLTRRPPFPGESINTILYNVAHGLPSIDESLDGIAQGGMSLKSVLIKVLEKDPAKRYQSAMDFAAHFRYALGASDQLPESGAAAQSGTGTRGVQALNVPSPPPDWNTPTVRMPHQPAVSGGPSSESTRPGASSDSKFDRATVPGTLSRVRAKRRINPWVAMASILGVVFAATIISVWLWHSRQNASSNTTGVTPDAQTVTLASTPSGASIYRDGTKIGKTPCDFSFPSGTHALEARMEGHDTDFKSIDVPLKTPVVTFSLRPQETQEPEELPGDATEPSDAQVEEETASQVAEDQPVETEAVPEAGDAEPAETHEVTAVELDQRDWNLAEQANTERAYRRYLQLHPQGRYAPDARGRIARLHVHREYKRAMTSTHEPDLETFLDRYPTSQYADEVRNRLDQLRFSKKYEAVLSATSPQELDAFLKANMHRLTQEQMEGIRSAQENLAYAKAMKTHDAAALKRYLDAYQGIHPNHQAKIQAEVDAIHAERSAFLKAHIGFPDVKKKTRIWGKKDFLVDYELTQAPPFQLLETTLAWRFGDAPEQKTTLRRNGPILNGVIPNDLLSSGNLSFRLILKDIDGLVYTFTPQDTEISK